MNFFFQRLESPEAKALKNRDFRRRFNGLTLADFYKHDYFAAAEPENKGDRVREILASAGEGRQGPDFASSLRGVRKNLILLDMFIYNRRFEPFFQNRRTAQTKENSHEKDLFISLLLIAGFGFWLMQSAKTPSIWCGFCGRNATVSMQQAYGETDKFMNAPVVMQGKITRQCPSSAAGSISMMPQANRLIEPGHMGIKFPQWVGRSAKVEGRLLQTKDGLELVGTGAEFF